MKIKFLKAWGFNTPGQIIEPDMIGVAEMLIRRGIAEEVREEAPPAQQPFKPKKK